MRTKFIKVSTADRLPEKSGIYTIEFKNQLIRSWFNSLNFFRNGEIVTADYWLQEIPDYEEEMHQMLLGIQDLDILPLEIEDELSLLLKKIRIQ